MQYLSMAKELKHSADGEADRSNQAMKYLEAALYFILSAKAMEGDPDHSASLTMYRDTLNFIKWVIILISTVVRALLYSISSLSHSVRA